MIDVSILMVSYNTSELTCAAIQSVYDQTRDVSFELIVVDNNSSDGSADEIAKRFPELNLIRLESNIGFAAANNLASEHATGKYILLLNPDTVVLDSAIDKLVGFAEENPEYGIYGGATRFGDMSRNPTAGWNMSTVWSLFSTAIGLSSISRRSRLFNPESLEWWDWSEPREVDIVTGCFLCIELDLWRKLEGFDVRFHMYAEDADLCLRSAEIGKKSILYPEAEIVHLGGASEGIRADKMSRLLKAKVQLFNKHWNPLKARYAIVMLKLWSLSRTLVFRLLYKIKPNKKASYESWLEIWNRRCEWVRV